MLMPFVSFSKQEPEFTVNLIWFEGDINSIHKAMVLEWLD